MKRGVATMESYDLISGNREVCCCICDKGNRFDAEFCRHCRAPLALSYQLDDRRRTMHLTAVLGPTSAGKTVFLGMLTDLLSRQNGPLQILARGAFSVSLQQQSMSALSRRQFPPPTPVDPEGWNWVHCEVSGNSRQKGIDVVMPDLSGKALFHESDQSNHTAVVRAFITKCSAALLLVDTEAIERGDQNQDFMAMKSVNYLAELTTDRRRKKPRRPVAVVFTKADCSDACWDDPAGYAEDKLPGLWRQCKERLGKWQFFAATVVGACAHLDDHGQLVSVPLRIEPRGIAEPFVWLVEQLRK
jgi:hypothetical protein